MRAACAAHRRKDPSAITEATSRQGRHFGWIPAPILAELVGISQNNAAKWVALAARDWATYISHRAEQLPE